MKKKIIPLSVIILFSIILWGSVTLSGDFTTTVKVKVRVTGLPKNFSLGTISHKEIYLRVKSKGWELAKLGLSGEPEFFVSAHRRIGKTRIDIRNEVENNTWLTSSFHLVEIAPSHIEINIDKSITKRVPIKPVINIDFKPDYGVASELIIEPKLLEISGSASLLQNIDTVYTQPYENKDVDSKVETKLALTEIDGVNFSTNECKIEFDVQKIVDKAFNDLIVEVRNVPSSKELQVSPSKISVVLKGGINKLGRLTNDSIKVYVDYWNVLRHVNETIEPNIEIPTLTTLIDVIPKKLEYVIKQF
ncbi:MAG: hypothetical protein AB1521_01180 [Bacteroidota bacterium]